ncbi:MAG: MFS transporter, partial [Actinobacteria bacterium]|nr:MFS transporter [Actinomycetota bacterium]
MAAEVDLVPAVQGDARHTRVVVSAGLAFYLALGVGLGVTGPSLVPMRTDFGLPYATVALVLVATGIGYLVGALVGGPLSDRYGRRRLMIGGTVGGCLGLAAVAVAPSFEMVFVAKVVTGLAYGVAEPTLTALLADAAREKSARAINIAQIAFAGGALLAPLMVGGLLASGLGWRPGFALGAGLFVL